MISVVGIGLSAGGLEPLRTILANLCADHSAYVVVSHRPVSVVGDGLRSILCRVTPLPVEVVEREVALEENVVYIAPGHGELDVLHDVVERTGTSPERPRPSVIDHLFTSLARARGKDAVVVILSGGGTDGIAGARAVHAAGGLVIAPDPHTALVPILPRHAIAAGIVDAVLAPEAIASFLRNGASRAQAE